ncbi:MAG: hypothetical protein JWM74_5291 [Myxococcaceae bacterium]|nr:hypothetical protein [Myxococcaceae bacterium]
MTEAGKKTTRAGERKPIQKKSLAVAMFTVLALFATTASAQTASAETKTTTGDGFMDQTDKDGQRVMFKDDPLAAENRGSTGATILVRPTAARVGLLRPRVQFVTEMLKSVENL